MLSKTNLISTLVTTIWGFFGGFLIWVIVGDPLLKDNMLTAGLMRDPADYTFLILGCLITGFVFSTVYSKWARGAHSISQGAQFGIWLGIFIGLGSGFIDHATSNILNLNGTLINGVLYIIHFAIMGVLASIIYKKIRTSAE